MRASRLATLLPRLAIAAAALVAGAVIFTTAGGLVAFGLWPDESTNLLERALERITRALAPLTPPAAS